ncbi:hypothetical protein K1719_011442 [Acacia pycnantha]|nr:hypothetical protein K1719_011442 [Acacia pycnantha]
MYVPQTTSGRKQKQQTTVRDEMSSNATDPIGGFSAKRQGFAPSTSLPNTFSFSSTSLSARLFSANASR